MEERYNDTRRCPCYESALLMKKNEIRTDRKHTLTTPEHVSVPRSSEHYVFFEEFSFRLFGFLRNPKGQKFFFGKEKNDKSIFLFP